MTTKKKAAKRAKGKRKAETSDEVSSIAGRLLRMLRSFPDEMVIWWNGNAKNQITVGDARALAGSCLVQDTTPGPRKAKGRGK